MSRMDGPFGGDGGDGGMTPMGPARKVTVLMPNGKRHAIPWRQGLTPKAALGSIPELNNRDNLYAVSFEGPRATSGSKNLTKSALHEMSLQPDDVLNVNSRLFAGLRAA